MSGIERDDIEKLKKYSEYAKDGVEKIQKYAEAARKLEEEGETLSALQGLATSIRDLSKFATALGGISIGLQLVLAFMPKQDPNKLILDGITELKSRIEALTQTVEVGLKRLELAEDISSQKSALLDKIANIEAAYALVQSIAKHRAEGTDPTYQIKELQDFDLGELRTIVQLIYNMMTGQELTVSLLQEVYDKTYGDAISVSKVAQYLFSHMQTCVIVISAIEYERETKEAKRDLTSEEIVLLAEAQSEILNPLIEGAGKASAYWISEALDEQKLRANVERFFADYRPQMHINHTNYQKSAENIVEKLQANWPYLKFSAVVYCPLAGFDHHCVWRSNDNAIVDFRTPDETGKHINLVVFWSARHSPHGPVVRSNQELVPKYDKPQPARYDRNDGGPLLEELFGGAPVYVSPHSATSERRTSYVIDLAWRLNRESYNRCVLAPGSGGILPARWHLQDGTQNFTSNYKKAHPDMVAGTPWMIWCGSCSTSEFGIASTNDACVMQNDEVFPTSMHDPNITAFRGKSQHSYNTKNGDLSGNFFRLAVFWGDPK